jgi:DNA-binding NarL/FixJ family response regulator
VISVALIEDHRLVREGISVLLNQVSDLRVVAAGASGDASRLRHVNPQVVLLDLGSRNGDSLRAAEKVVKEFPVSKVIVMDLPPMHEDIVEFVNVGVSGFITKDATLDDLVGTIRTVADGAHVLPPPVTATPYSRIVSDAVARSRPDALDSVRMTPREREVIALIAEGLSNEEISDQLRIATDTVRSHVRNVMEKLTLHTRLQIAAYAHRDGISHRETGEASRHT